MDTPFGLLVYLYFFAVVCVPYIIYISILQKALKVISLENRKLSPAKVWLLLIPLFNLYWYFVVVEAIGRSFQAEYEKYEKPFQEKPTRNLGIFIGCIQLLWFLPFESFKTFIWVTLIVCWLFHWISVTHHIATLKRLAVTSSSTVL